MAQEHTVIIEVPNKKAHQLYTSAREWFALTFKSANDVIQMQDSVAGKIIGKGSAAASTDFINLESNKKPVVLSYNIDFTVAIAIKDNKFKASITDIFVTPSNSITSSILFPSKESYIDLVGLMKDGFREGSDPEWIKKQPLKKNELKHANASAKAMAKDNMDNYLIICKIEEITEDKIKQLLTSLELKMKMNDDNW